ncbi:MAG: hypothetical protein SangKO_030290 [Sandaracinaceae bacterium]
MRCWARRDGAWAGLEGPAWADDVGWSRPRHYQTVRLADLNGDGLDDLCARAGAGWRCHLSDGAGFGDAIELGDMTNDGGWSSHVTGRRSSARAAPASPRWRSATRSTTTATA